MHKSPSSPINYLLHFIGSFCGATLVLIFLFPAHMNVILGIFIGLLLVLFIYNIMLVAGKNIVIDNKELCIRDIFYRKTFFQLKQVKKIEVHTNFICRIYDIKIILVQEGNETYKLYVAKVKPEELKEMIDAAN
jgi:hypothetical protein